MILNLDFYPFKSRLIFEKTTNQFSTQLTSKLNGTVVKADSSTSAQYKIKIHAPARYDACIYSATEARFFVFSNTANWRSAPVPFSSILCT